MTAGGAYTLKAATIEAMPIPESSTEQQRIVAKIEELFEQIDKISK